MRKVRTKYINANDIAAEKRVALFLTLMGSEAYALLRNLCAPELPSRLSLEQLRYKMKEHLQPKPSILSERFKFKECRQREDESIIQYLASLKKTLYLL